MLKIVDIDVATEETKEPFGYCFVDLSTSHTAFNLIACPSCLSIGSLKLSDDGKLKKEGDDVATLTLKNFGS